jgi:hypothetical protein
MHAEPSSLRADYAARGGVSATSPRRLFPQGIEQDQSNAANFRANSGSTSSVEAF